MNKYEQKKKSVCWTKNYMFSRHFKIVAFFSTFLSIVWLLTPLLHTHTHTHINIPLTFGYFTALRGDQASLDQRWYGNVPASRATVSGVTGATATQVIEGTDVLATLLHHRDCIVHGAITVICRQKKKQPPVSVLFKSQETVCLCVWVSLLLYFYLCSSRRWQGPGRTLCLPCRCNLRPEWRHQPRCSKQEWQIREMSDLWEQKKKWFCIYRYISVWQVLAYHRYTDINI